MNNQENRILLRLCNGVGLHYIGFSSGKPSGQTAIADPVQNIFSILLQLRNLG